MLNLNQGWFKNADEVGYGGSCNVELLSYSFEKVTSLIVCSNRNGSISEACPLFVAGMFADIPSYGMSDQCPPGSVKRV